MTVNFVRANAAKVSQVINVDVIGVTQGLREVIFELDSPVTSVELDFDVHKLNDNGSGDGCLIRLGDFDINGDWQGGNLFQSGTAQIGTATVTSPSGQTKLWCHLGYTSTEPVNYTKYDDNECMFKINQACE